MHVCVSSPPTVRMNMIPVFAPVAATPDPSHGKGEGLSGGGATSSPRPPFPPNAPVATVGSLGFQMKGEIKENKQRKSSCRRRRRSV